jgi:hypothetical protein
VLGVVMEQFRCSCPFLVEISEIASPDTVQSMLWLMQELPQDKLAQFAWTSEKEFSKEGIKDFLGR